jgi:predicted O-methyltransferase YrrM
MDYQRIRDFIISYSHDDEGLLGNIYDKAVADEVPIIRKETRDFLKVLLRMAKPESVLEVGTAVGYSTLVMAEVLSDYAKTDSEYADWHIDTLELDESRIKEAARNFSKAGFSDRISLISGDAAETMKNIQGKEYDFIFIDAAKAQYMTYMEEAIRLSHTETIIVTDNILSDGEVLESHFLVEKRDRTIHDRMREFVYRIKNDERLETAILSVGDGLAVSVVENK